jgi:hypothetical protein
MPGQPKTALVRPVNFLLHSKVSYCRVSASLEKNVFSTEPEFTFSAPFKKELHKIFKKKVKRRG